MTSLRIFYAWQSDRGSDCCSNFVRKALEAAIADLAPSYGEELVLDSDTAGLAGSPRVTENILKKIRECDVFLGDLSFVAQTDGGKQLPNPNVMIELGFARAVLDEQQIMLVMNEAFGGPKELPFDLAHLRHPLGWTLSEGAPAGERRATRTKFAGKLKTYLAASIDFALRLRASVTPESDRFAPARELVASLDLPSFTSQPPAIVNGPKLVLRMATVMATNHPAVEPARMKAARPLFVPEGYTAVETGTSAGQFYSHDPKQSRAGLPNGESRWYTRFVQPGIVETSILLGEIVDDDPTAVIEGRAIEGRIVETIRRLAALFAEVGQHGSASLSVAFHQLEDVQVSTSRWTSRPLGWGMPMVWFVDLPSLAGFMPLQLKALFNSIWLAVGFEDGSTSFNDSEWTGDTSRALYEPATIIRRDWS
jgi:hypothetical protein